MKLKNIVAIISFCVWCVSSSSYAATITVLPSAPSISEGGQATVNLKISGLGDASAPSLSVFDLDVIYDSSVLSFGGAVFGDQLDFFGLGSLQTIDDTVAGALNVFELSFDFPEDLDSLQANSFMLVALTFSAIGSGLSDISLLINSLGDSLGDPLAANVINASIDVVSTSPVPLPGALGLMSIGLAGLAGVGRRLKRC